LHLSATTSGTSGRTPKTGVIPLADAARESGLNTVDTADVYSAGESEELLGAAIAGRREDIVLATKAGLPMGEDLNRRGTSRRWLIRAVEDSLRRLGVDHIDLYQMHRWDPVTSDEETLGALTVLQRAGKSRHFGTSTNPAYRLVQAQWAAEARTLRRFVTEQPNYSILQRGIERDVLPAAQDHRLGVLTWSPLASGWLSGTIRAGAEVTTNRSTFMSHRFDLERPENRAKLDAVEKLAAVAQGAGLTMIQL